MARRYEAIKVWIDFPLAAILLVLAAPIIMTAMLLVRLTSRGPAIYTQKRLGLRGRVFTIFKIRTMCSNSEANGVQWSLPGDRRITPIGRFLRWSHIDELPQLVNVVRGDMGLVGPRPERPEIVTQIERSLPDYHSRLAIRPGLTGMAQVLQAPDTDLGTVRRKLAFDLQYIERMSFRLDMLILFATVLHVLAVPGERIDGMLGLADADVAFTVDVAPVQVQAQAQA